MLHRTAALLLAAVLCCQVLYTQADCTGPASTNPAISISAPCSQPQAIVSSGTSCPGSCSAGYELAYDIVPAAYCTDNYWIVNGCCQPKGCSYPPPNVSSNTWLDECASVAGTAPSGQCCSGTCDAGTTTINDSPSVCCYQGSWTLGGGICQGPSPSPVPVPVPGPVATPCLISPDSSLVNNTTWNCPATGSTGTCTGSCTTGAADPVSGPPVATCNYGQWVYTSGACTAPVAKPCLTPPNSTLVDRSIIGNTVWNCSSTASGATCQGSCASGVPDDVGGPPIATCTDGEWTYTSGACTGCTGNPSFALAPNTTWNCPAVTLESTNCTGTCSSGSPTGTSGLPVAVCNQGVWNVITGSCTGGTKTRFFTVEGPQDLIDAIAAAVAAGEAIELINEELQTYQAILQRNWPQLAGMTDIEVINFFVAQKSQGGSTGRKLSAAGTSTITVGFQMASTASGMYGFAQDLVLDHLTTSPRVVPVVTNWAIGAAVKLNLLPATFNFSGVSVGPSNANGELISAPVITSGSGCFVVFQTTGPAQQTLCPDTKVFSADFPYSTSSGITYKSFTAVAVDMAAGSGADRLVNCGVDSSGGSGSSPSARVVCTRVDGSPYPPKSLYKVLLTSEFYCADIRSRAFASANFLVQSSPNITIQQEGLPKPLVCADAGTVSVEYSFNVTADASAGQISLGSGQQQQAATATSSVAGTDCTVKLFPGPPTTVGSMSVVSGTATVTCKGAFPKAPSTLDINFMLTASTQTCGTTSGTAKTRVSVVCCKQGRSYARQQKVGDRHAKCFSYYLPGTTSSNCSSSSAVSGLFNQGPATARFSFFDNSTAKCATRATVGTAVMSCDSSNKKLANFKLQSHNRDLAADQQFLLSCTPPTIKAGTCPGNVQWQSVLMKGQDRTIRLAGRTKVTTFSAALPAGASCDCQDAVWAVYESGVYTGLPGKLCN